jgi:hypothetical protein
MLSKRVQHVDIHILIDLIKYIGLAVTLSIDISNIFIREYLYWRKLLEKSSLINNIKPFILYT